MALITGRDFGLTVPDPDALIVSDARGSAGERVHVYAHMYRARMVEALESQFPRLARLLGAEAFAALAVAYVGEEPSRQPSLRGLGERLPVWLEARKPEQPELAGLAHLEWARTDVFDLADQPALTLDALRAWPAERFGELPLQLVGAHRLVTACPGTARRWDVLGGDLANRGEATPGGVGTESLVVWREGTVVYHRLVDEAERAALALTSEGTRFGVLCESLLAGNSEESAIAQAYAWMSTWLADGLLRSHPGSTPDPG